MKVQGAGWIKSVLSRAKEKALDLEPWPHYFESKAREFTLISDFCGICMDGDILEIGCGNGFTSALLSERARHVTAFDLPSKDASTHSIGIKAGGELIDRMALRNVSAVAGSSESLPFPDNSFDLIFSAYMLQYVRRKDVALAQMRRLLRSDGALVIVVPNFMERIAAPVMKYQYLIKRILFYLKQKLAGNGRRSVQLSMSPSLRTDGPRSAFEAALDLLLLKPDGAYKSFMEETIKHTAHSWRALLARNGFVVTKTFTTEILPLGVFDFMGEDVKKFLAKKSHHLNKSLGATPVIKNLGYSIAFVARKATR